MDVADASGSVSARCLAALENKQRNTKTGAWGLCPWRWHPEHVHGWKARLEWALNRARHAEDAAPIDPGALRAVPPESVPSIVFQLEPSLTLLRSPWPIDRLWRANQPDGEGTVDLDAGGAWLEVRRAGDDVGFRALDPATHAFRAAIAGSEPLGDAADAALGVDPRFDLAAALHALLDDGVGIGLSVNGLPKKES